MFEDSTFESTGRIKTRSRRWMFATFILNGGILATLILLPLIYPDAMPRHMLTSLLVVPEAPRPEPPPEPVRIQRPQSHNFSEQEEQRIIAPASFPRTPLIPSAPELPFHADNIGGENGSDIARNNVFNSRPATVVHPSVPSIVRLPSSFTDGILIYKSIPQYPAIAKVTHTEGTVILQAVISKTGTIENLHVISGPAMLQQAAIDAVKDWRYKPYLLNQQPVEVETTVNVIFRLER